MPDKSSEMKFQLITFDRMIANEMLLAELDKRGLRLATKEEMDAFQKIYFPEIKDANKSIWDDKWNEFCRFLSVRE